jgi:hypothetical protein
LEIGFLLFFFSLCLCVQQFQEVGAAMWYRSTRAQKFEVKQIFQEQRKIEVMGKKGEELKDYAKYWAQVNVVF